MTETNPLRERLGATKFDQAVQFYEADQKLTPEDRVQLRDDIKQVLVTENIYSYSAGIAAFLMPTIYFRFFNKAALNPRSFIQKPLLSVGLGMANLYMMFQIYAKNLYKEKLDLNLPESQMNIWKTMDRNLLGIYLLYYAKSSQDPLERVPDPRSFTADQVRFDPEKYKRAEGPDHVLTTWDRIRLNNGLDITATTEEPKSGSAWDEIRKK